MPRLDLLQRRLEKSGSPPKPTESVYLANASAHARPQAKATSSQPVAPQKSAPVGDLPDGVVELFTRRVQPVLVNSCTAAACHQAGGKQSFQLDRAILRGESNRRTTMRNLEAALALIDREHPDLSPLLTIPRRTHGGMSGPIYGPRQEAAYRHLVDWVALVVPSKDETAAPEPDANPLEATDEGGKMAAQPIRSKVKPNLMAASPLPIESRPTADVLPATASDLDVRPTLKQPHRLQVGA
jgi:hypothetical protein